MRACALVPIYIFSSNIHKLPYIFQAKTPRGLSYLNNRWSPKHLSTIYKDFKNFIKSQFVCKQIQGTTSNIVNNNMKLLKIICLLSGAISAIRFPSVGLSESYLELTRKYSYLQLMKHLSLASRKTVVQKIRKQQIAKFRAELAKAMQAEQGAGQTSKRNTRRIKSQGRMNRFRTFHN